MSQFWHLTQGNSEKRCFYETVVTTNSCFFWYILHSHLLTFNLLRQLCCDRGQRIVLECDDGSDSICWPSQQCADHQGRLRILHPASWLAKISPSRLLIGQQLTLRSHLDTGHWTCDLMLGAATDSSQECNIVQRQLHLKHPMMTFSKHWQHCKHRVFLTPRFKVHYPPFLSRQLLYWPQSRSLTPVFARSYHPQHQNVQSSIKSQR